jgi:hypothetical protein
MNQRLHPLPASVHVPRGRGGFGISFIALAGSLLLCACSSVVVAEGRKVTIGQGNRLVVHLYPDRSEIRVEPLTPWEQVAGGITRGLLGWMREPAPIK